MITPDMRKLKPTHTQRLVDALCKAGWAALVVPEKGRLKPNRQLVEFRTPTATAKVRFSIFTVGDRGESHRRDERRIQITTTYLSGLERRSGFRDIVLGYDSDNDAYVGLDARRLKHGGKKHNASSSVDSSALEQVPPTHIVVRPHETQIFGIEYQAIFRPNRIAEYVFNIDLIHRGLYVGDGLFSDSRLRLIQRVNALNADPNHEHGEILILSKSATPPTQRRTSQSRISAYENSDWKTLADVTPEELEALRRRCAELGDRGEYFVYRYEKQRLRRLGKDSLAKKVDWISRRAVGRGYDIRSYDTDGSARLIEVKSTSGSGMVFPMSNYEWKVATREKEAYYIYRVVDVGKSPLLKRVIRNPVEAEEKRRIERTASGWRITLK